MSGAARGRSRARGLGGIDTATLVRLVRGRARSAAPARAGAGAAAAPRPRPRSVGARLLARVRDKSLFPLWETLSPESKNALFEILFQCCDAKHDTDDKRATFGVTDDLMAYTICKRIELQFRLTATDSTSYVINCTVEELVDNYVKDCPGTSIEKKLRAFATVNCPELFYLNGPRLLSVGDIPELTLVDRNYMLGGVKVDDLPAGEFIVTDEAGTNTVIANYKSPKGGESFYIADGCPAVEKSNFKKVMSSMKDSSTGFAGLAIAPAGPPEVFDVRPNVLMTGGLQSRNVRYSLKGTPGEFYIVVHCTGHEDKEFLFPNGKNSGPTLPYLGALCVSDYLLGIAVNTGISDEQFETSYNAWATDRGTHAVTEGDKVVDKPYVPQYNQHMYNFRPILQHLHHNYHLDLNELKSILITEKGDGDAVPPIEGHILYNGVWCGIITVDELCALGASLAKGATYTPAGILNVYTYQSKRQSVWRFLHIPPSGETQGQQAHARYVQAGVEYNALVDRLNYYKSLCVGTVWSQKKQDFMVAAGLVGAGASAGAGAAPSNMNKLKELVFEKYIDSKLHFYTTACEQLNELAELNKKETEEYNLDNIEIYKTRSREFDKISKTLSIHDNIFNNDHNKVPIDEIRDIAARWTFDETALNQAVPPAMARSRSAIPNIINMYNLVFGQIDSFVKQQMKDTETYTYVSALLASLRTVISYNALTGNLVDLIHERLEKNDGGGAAASYSGSGSGGGGGAAIYPARGGTRHKKKVYHMIGGADPVNIVELTTKKNDMYSSIEQIEAQLDDDTLDENDRNSLTVLKYCCMAQLEYLDKKYDYDREFNRKLNFISVYHTLLGERPAASPRIEASAFPTAASAFAAAYPSYAAGDLSRITTPGATPPRHNSNLDSGEHTPIDGSQSTQFLSRSSSLQLHPIPPHPLSRMLSGVRTAGAGSYFLKVQDPPHTPAAAGKKRSRNALNEPALKQSKSSEAEAGPVPVPGPVAGAGAGAGAMDDLGGGARKNKTRKQTRKHKSKTRKNRPRFTKRTRRNKH